MSRTIQCCSFFTHNFENAFSHIRSPCILIKDMGATHPMCNLRVKLIKKRANRQIKIVHSDIMGSVIPSFHPKRYHNISVFINDYSRLTMAYPENKI